MQTIEELRRAANANLVALINGSVRRRALEQAERRRADAALAREAAKWQKQQAARQRKETATLRERLAEIDGIEKMVAVDFPEELRRGALEELDSERDTICERLYRLEQRL